VVDDLEGIPAWDITVDLTRSYRTTATEYCCPSNQVNITMALQATEWEIYGTGGAAERLGLKPTTVLSRIKKMGIEKGRVRVDDNDTKPLFPKRVLRLPHSRKLS